MTKEVFILVYECPDKSAFRICGTTSSMAVAKAWNMANDDTKVFLAEIDNSPIRWDQGIPEWNDDCVEKKIREIKFDSNYSPYEFEGHDGPKEY